MAQSAKKAAQKNKKNPGKSFLQGVKVEMKKVIWPTKRELQKMKAAVADHTTDVLSFMKENGIDVEWIQIGNETTTGMLWPLGLASDNNFANYAALNNAGYDAAKAVYPDAQCIIHIDQGNQLGRFTWMFDGLKAAGAKWDVIGMSLYPEDDNWQTVTDDCLANISTLAARYNNKALYALGGAGIGGCKISAFDGIGKSIDYGFSWNKSSDVVLPADFESSATAFTAFADNNGYLWIICGGTGAVWKGHLNRVGWDD